MAERLRAEPRAEPRTGSWLATGWLALALACAGAGARAREPVPRAAPVTSGFEAGARAIEVAGQGLELLLPDAAGWRHDGREAHSWVVTHAATGSRLVARAWQADELVHAADCERQMRLWRPDWPAVPVAPDGEEVPNARRPIGAGSTRPSPAQRGRGEPGTHSGHEALDRVESRALRVAGDYAAELWSAVATTGDGALLGLAQLSASDGRQCLCLAYTTSARGAAAARLIGERLGAITRLAFERVRRLDIGERVLVPRR